MERLVSFHVASRMFCLLMARVSVAPGKALHRKPTRSRSLASGELGSLDGLTEALASSSPR